MASIGHSISGPRFVEMDEVSRILSAFCLFQANIRHSGLTAKRRILMFSSHSFVASSKPSKLYPSSAMVRLCRPHRKILIDANRTGERGG